MHAKLTSNLIIKWCRSFMIRSSSSSTQDQLKTPAFLLSLLLKNQSRRITALQVHSYLLTTALCHKMDIDGMRVCNTLIRHYSLGCFPIEAIDFYEQMKLLCNGFDLYTDTFTLCFLLKACANLLWHQVGIQFHGLVVKKGLIFNVFTDTALVNMYVACGRLVEAKRVFDDMPERNSVSWNAMITGFASLGKLDEARLLFERMPDRNVVSWTGLIDGYTRALRSNDALMLFRKMVDEGVRANEITMLAIVPAIFNLGELSNGEALHAFCLKTGFSISDVRVENSLIDMYAKCGAVDKSLDVFNHMGDRRTLVSWTSIITAFALHGLAKEATTVFEELGKAKIKPSRITYLSILNACNHGGLVDEGLKFFRMMVYEHDIKPDIKHYGCLIDMMGRAGRLHEAEKMIEEMEAVEVNAVVWRTLLGSCSKHGDVEMAERVMQKIMELEKGHSGDYIVLSNMLTEIGRFDDAEKIRTMMECRNVVKIPGHSLVAQKQES